MELNEITETKYAVLICCSDPRLHPSRNGLETKIGNLCSSAEGVYLISLPGASKDLVVGGSVIGSKETRSDFLRYIDIFVNSYENEDVTVFICHHRDCKAYKCYMFSSPEDEKRTQVEHMKKAQNIIREKFPGVEIILLWDNLYNKGGEIGIEIIP